MTQNTDQATSLVWFRHDLRISDNPALHFACKAGAPVFALYVLDESLPNGPGGAARWWLHHSLAALAKDLETLNVRLILRRGPAKDILPETIEAVGANAVYWNRRYFPDHVESDTLIKAALKDQGVAVGTFNGALLREPWELQTAAGGYFKVYSPFWRALQKVGPARDTLLQPIPAARGGNKGPIGDKLADWRLLPKNPNWAAEFEETWSPGEQGASHRLTSFLDGPVEEYADGRNRPDCEWTSRLSPHLAFGEISPLMIWRETQSRIESGAVNATAGEKFLSEIAWREFSYNLLFNNADLPNHPLRQEFSNFPWRDDPDGLNAWRQGRTGYPIVDAGMRQLWRTGWMHNRVRMIAASFLIKDLLVPWQHGHDWFWDTLVDADIANNAASWQWVAGCGADAAPYFRIFNPVTQGKKFDPEGDYVRRFVPELAKMPKKFIHEPWTAPDKVLQDAGVTLGNSYPLPILDHGEARKRALDGYEQIKAG